MSGDKPMLAKLVGRLPRPDGCPGGCRYEPKWDGFRALARIDRARDVVLTSRRSRPMMVAFPDIVQAVAAEIPPGTTIDGEIVRWSGGRLDFEALQRRNSAGRRASVLARSEPCHYVVFDLLELRGRNQRARPLSERRAALERLLKRVPPTSPITLGMQTDDVEQAKEWFESLAAVGIEGLVIKAAHQPYLPGGRRWWKVKRYASADAIVGGVTGDLARPHDLILGRRSSATGALIVVGRTATLDDRAAAEIATWITRAGEEHPWPAELPPSWTSSIYGRREPTPYVRVVPEIVIEARVDVATVHGRWRHPLRFLRIRHDLRPGLVPLDLEVES